MTRFDLHTHSNCSDGTMTPAELVALAADRGLSGIALTDHDSTAGVEAARAVGASLRVEVLTGCELSAEHEGKPVHVLGLCFDPEEPVFAEKRRWIFTGRQQRAAEIVEKLHGLGKTEVSVDRVTELAAGGAVGRPHIAAAMVSAGVVTSETEAFTQDWIGTGGRAYVPKRAVSPVEAVELIRGAHGVAVLAHPSIWDGHRPVPKRVIREMAEAGLGALEVDHPDQRRRSRAHWRRLARKLGLDVTGGSDCHGERFGYRLGVETTPGDRLEALLARRG